ncbi:hypothetical protein CLU79DRAFT_718594 [Phycomyces nitens]|nr:hypothetical protein CLU79DRAFT_718594 [Phycomyces nitens]
MVQTIDSPVANDSITNKPASQKASLYYTCRSVLQGLAAVPGFESYLNQQQDSITNVDPLSKLWSICKQGDSLCLLYNTLMPDSPINIARPDPKTVIKPKAYIYHFIVACRDQLHFPEESLFTLTDLWQNDTNGFVKVVDTLKRILDLLEDQGIISIHTATNRNSDPNAPKNMRDKVVIEFLETERKYVQDLETLQNYMREAQIQDVLPRDTLHHLFGNLNALVDFQRRFLIQLEDNADRAPQEQRFGNMFIQLEEAFAVYEPFCANFQRAQDLVLQEGNKLQRLADILNPVYELPSMLIKPVQRVCKYPLLMQEIVKGTPEDWKYSDEMKAGHAAIQRIASNVNETKRCQENELIVEDLKRRIEGWKGPIENFGLLLLQDKFFLMGNDSGREMTTFLFEKTLLICKEELDTNRRANGMMKKKKKETTFVVKGKIMISKIVQVVDTSSQGQCLLRIFWSDKGSHPQSLQHYNLQTFVLKCRNNEQLKQWESLLNKRMQVDKRIQTEKGLTLEMKADSRSSPSLPQTPRTPHGTELDDSYSMICGEDDEEEEYQDHSSEEEDSHRLYDQRSQSSLQRSRGPEHGEYHRKASQSSVSLGLPNSGRHYPNMPGMALPPLPRSPTHLMTGQDTTLTSYADHPYYPSSPYPSSPPTSYPSSPSLSTRASASSTKSSNGYWRRHDEDGLAPTEMIARAMMSDHMISTMDDTVQYGYSTGYTIVQPKTALLSTTFVTPETPSQNFHHTRVRSQSSPNIHPPNGLFDNAPDVPTINSRTLYQSKRSSNGFEDKHGQPVIEEDTQVKVHFMGDVYVVMASIDIPYNVLLYRIEHTLRQYGRELDTTFSIKYQDEDGDLITISSDDDVQMGFETRNNSNAVDFYVTYVA